MILFLYIGSLFKAYLDLFKDKNICESDHEILGILVNQNE